VKLFLNAYKFLLPYLYVLNSFEKGANNRWSYNNNFYFCERL